MRIDEIIDDVFKDFRRTNPDSDFNESLIRFGLKSVVEPITKDLDDGIVYALCMESIYELLVEFDLFDGITSTATIVVLSELFSKPMDKHIEDLDYFLWIPEILEDAYSWGNYLFQRAKDVYYGFDSETKVDYEVYIKLEDTLEKLNSISYRYRSKDEIINLYNNEFEESKLDFKVIRGERAVLSKRLSSFVNQVDSIPVGEIENII